MIEFDHVSKQYQIGTGHNGLRSALAALPRTLLGRGSRSIETGDRFWALRDVTLAAGAGEALGIVGRNGAGKTTILKLLSGITSPTSGRISVTGRVAALIELGAGFHPDLTGLENVYLYGTILGLRRRELDSKLKSIVDFAELHTFMDTPVKRYSSGMYARLAFSVAAHVNPDVLLVDEVLSVGDNQFQQKCFDFLHLFVRSGKTTVFISHSLYVEHLCDRMIWLDHGRVMETGSPGRVLEHYLGFLEQAGREADDEQEGDSAGSHVGTERLRVDGVVLSDRMGQRRTVFTTGDDVVMSVQYECRDTVEHPQFCVWVSETVGGDQPLFAANMLLDGQSPDRLSGRGSVSCIFRNVPLMPRTYHVWVEVYGQEGELLSGWRRMGSFQVVDPALLNHLDGQKGAMRFAKAHAPMRVAYEWLPSQDLAERQSADEPQTTADRQVVVAK